MAELTRLGRYELRRVLGRGAMGVVYEGYDPKLNRRVAVKTILRNAAIDAETAQHYSAQFAREAQAAGRLNHSHIVHVHDFAEEGDVAYLVMEYIEGRELRSYFEAREAFAPAEAVRIMGELLDALDYAHEAGIIHRDVKPANVMLDAQRRVKLADFGVARIQDSERSAAGTMVGTPAFMSPEQIQGLKIDRRTDIFSAGTILYQPLTGEQPFTGQGAWTVARKIMQEDPPQPSSVVKSVSPVFDGIVGKALAKTPAQRYASAKEFAAALRAALAPAQPSAMASIPPAAPAARAEAKASETELEFWRAIQNSTDAAEFEFYLEQFPEGAYARLARHKIAKLKGAAEAEDTVRLEAEAAAKRKAEEENARQEAEAQARREAQEKARREAEERARRETEEKIRQAQALARLKQQEEAAAKARAKAAADEDSTVALPPRREPAAAAAPVAAEKPKSFAIPAIIAAVVVAGGIAAYLIAGRTPAPTPVAETAPPKPAAAPAAPAVDPEKIRRETEDRLRKEFAEKAAAERAALEKSLADKVAAEAAAAKKVADAKGAAEKAAAEKAAAAAAAARQAAEKAAAEKAAAQQKAVAEKAAAERAAADKAAAEKAAAEKAAAEKLAAEKAAAEKAAAEKAAAEKQAGAAGTQALLDRFVQRVGREKVLNTEPALSTTVNCYSMPYPCGSVLYVNDGSCSSGAIKEITIENPVRNSDRSSRCISLADSKPLASKPAAASRAAVAAPAAASASAAPAHADGKLERFMQREGRHKFFRTEREIGPLAFQELVYVLQGCPSGQVREVRGGNNFRNTPRSYRCIPIPD